MNQYYSKKKYSPKQLLIISLLNIIYLFGINAQTLELGILAGGANYQGDLASSEFKVITQQSNVAIGGFLRYAINESFALKLQVVKTELEGDDANSSFDFLEQRNLRFFSPLLDASLRLEWYPFVANSEYQQVILPYLSLGGSFFTFNPQAEYLGQIYELRPLNTEGQGLPSFPNRKPYSLYSGSVLTGIGVKFLLNEDLTLGLDISANYTFTDYLDDVSDTYAGYQELAFTYGTISADISYQVDDFFDLNQTTPLPGTRRGNPNLNDLFFIAGITLSYNLVNPERASGREMGCPTF
ncbi:MAG: DUF6089 family protein [Saprospiraceae bacterium]